MRPRPSRTAVLVVVASAAVLGVPTAVAAAAPAAPAAPAVVPALHPGGAGTASIAGALRYGGGLDGIGVTTGHEKVYLVLWGAQWGLASTGSDGYRHFSGDPQGVAPRLQALFKGLGTNGELWSGVLTQYCEGVPAGATSCPGTAAHVAYPTGGALAGVWEDSATPAPGAATKSQLAGEALRAATHFGNTTASANRDAQYVVVSPTGTDPDDYEAGGFCAWHDWNGAEAYTNLPYLPDAGTSCGMNYVNAGSAGTLDSVTIVEGAEYADTVTDQVPPGGWTDATGGYETAAKCAWNGVGGPGGASDVSFATGSFAMQATWSNAEGACEISGPVVGTP